MGTKYRGVFEPTALISGPKPMYGGEGKPGRVKEADRYHPDDRRPLLLLLGHHRRRCRDVAKIATQQTGTRVLAIRSEGFGGDFRSGYEDAFRALMALMEPRGEVLKGTINVLGARQGPTYTEWTQDLDELERLVHAIGAEINAILCGGCTVDQIRRAPAAELNASWCFDWGQKLGDLMEERFKVPYARTGQPYGPAATEEWIMGVATPLGLGDRASEVIRTETAAVAREIDTLRRCFEGRTALIEIAEFPGPIRALSLARMAAEFMRPSRRHHLRTPTLPKSACPAKVLARTGLNPK